MRDVLGWVIKTWMQDAAVQSVNFAHMTKGAFTSFQLVWTSVKPGSPKSQTSVAPVKKSVVDQSHEARTMVLATGLGYTRKQHEDQKHRGHLKKVPRFCHLLLGWRYMTHKMQHEMT